MKILNVLKNGDNQFYIFCLSDNLNGLFYICDNKGNIQLKNEFPDYIDIKILLKCIDDTAYCMFARDNINLNEYFNSTYKAMEYKDCRIPIRKHIAPLNVCVNSFQISSSSSFNFGLSDDFTKGVMTISDKSTILTQHFFNDIEDLFILYGNLSLIGDCLLFRNYKTFDKVLNRLPDIKESDFKQDFLEEVSPVCIRGLL